MQSPNWKFKKMINKNLEYIKINNPSPCYTCEGTGFAIGPGISRKKACKHICKTCNGTGLWIEDNYHLIATLPTGSKIAFQVDVGK